MSWEGMAWAIEQDVFPSNRKFVLVLLGNYCGDTGLSYPSVGTLAAATGLKEETVAKALKDLVAAGYIEDTGKKNGETGRIRIFKLPEAAWANTHRNGGIKKRRNTPPNGGIQSPANPPLIPQQSSGNPPVILRSSGSPNIKELELDMDSTVEAQPQPTTTGNPEDRPAEARNDIPEAVELCVAFGTEIGLDEDQARAFFDHFSSNGWRVGGKTAMKDWRAAMRNWKRNQNRFGQRNDTRNGNNSNGLGWSQSTQQRNAQIVGAASSLAAIRENSKNPEPAPWDGYE